MNNVTKALIEAKAVISKPENWTQNAYARDIDGFGVDVHDTSAVCFCSLGALRKTAVSSTDTPAYIQAKEFLVDVCGMVASFNDQATHAEVMEMWDRAIEASKQ